MMPLQIQKHLAACSGFCGKLTAACAMLQLHRQPRAWQLHCATAQLAINIKLQHRL